jgi:hypothetical protein
MWIFTRYGFYSAAVYKTDPDNVTVRARVREHLVNLKEAFPDVKDLRCAIVRETPRSDYLYRLMLPKHVWAGLLSRLASEQSWDNFKNECHSFGGNNAYTTALYEIWWKMLSLQPVTQQQMVRYQQEDFKFADPVLKHKRRAKKCRRCKAPMQWDHDQWGDYRWCPKCGAVDDTIC